MTQAEELIRHDKNGRLATLKVSEIKFPIDIAATNIIKSKKEACEYDVFMCHNSEDKNEVKEIANKLKSYGILPWLDEWELRPGYSWQKSLSKHIGSIKSVAIFLGNSGIGPWQEMEVMAFLRQFYQRKCPFIPVLLQNTTKSYKDYLSDGEMEPLIGGICHIDFRIDDPDPSVHDKNLSD